MSRFFRILGLVLAIGLGLLIKNYRLYLGDIHQLPDLPRDQWWGEGPAPSDMEAYIANNSKIINNRLLYPQERIDELIAELNRSVKLTEPLEGVNFEYGFNSKYLEKIITYWRDDYLPRWRSREVFLWQFNHFTTNIQGLRMHFFHLMAYEDALEGRVNYPVLLLHGWPGSVRELYELTNMLHQKALKGHSKYIFNVVVPSLPGFAWSQGTSKPGLGPAQIAVIMHNLMTRLGYEKYFIQGGDWGALIGSHIATLYPDSVLGYHSNLCTNFAPKSLLKGFIANLMPNLFLPKGYEDFFIPASKHLSFLIEEMGYYHLQATKPDTIGSVLTDNPVGLAAYILEKFSTWTDPGNRHLPDGGLEDKFEFDDLLDNIMIYYMTRSITTSQRIYAEHASSAQRALQLDRIPTNVPTGCGRFENDLLHFLDFQLKDKYPNLIHSTYYREGGHFLGFEIPGLLHHDFIKFIRKVEKFRKL